MDEKRNSATPLAFEGGKPQMVGDLVDYQPGGIVSRTLYKGPHGTLTIFAFDQGQSLSEHTAPFDAFVHILDGEAVVTVGSRMSRCRAGHVVFLPAGVPHALDAPERFKMLLTMFRANVSSG